MQLRAAHADRGAVSDVREALDALVEDDDFWAEQARSLAVFASPASLRTFRLPNRLTPPSRSATASTSSRCCGRSASRRPRSSWRSRPARCASSRSLAKDRRSRSTSPTCRPTRPARRARPRSPTALRARGCRAPRARRSGCASSPGRSTRHCGRHHRARAAAHPRRDRPLASIYRSLNSYPHLVERGIPGNPERTSDAELAADARTVLDEVYADELSAIRERLRPALRVRPRVDRRRRPWRARRPTAPWTRCWSTSTRSCPGTSTRRPAT